MSLTDPKKRTEMSDKLSTALQKVGAAMYDSPAEASAQAGPKPEEELPKDDGSPDTNVPEDVK